MLLLWVELILDCIRVMDYGISSGECEAKIQVSDAHLGSLDGRPVRTGSGGTKDASHYAETELIRAQLDSK